MFKFINFFSVLFTLIFFVSCGSKRPPAKQKPKALAIDFSSSAGLQKPEVRITGVEWDVSSKRLLTEGIFGRLLKLDDRVLCFYEDNASIHVKSGDLDLTGFGESVKLADFPGGLAVNPRGLLLGNGEVLCFYVESPIEDLKSYFALKVIKSLDKGKTWGAPVKIYQAGNHYKSGCWEPSAIQLSSGEIQLFFTNEYPYGQTNEKEISLVKSTDNGGSWSIPEKIVFKKNTRSGAPSPIILNSQVFLAYMQESEEKSLKKGKPFIAKLGSGVEPWRPFIRDLKSEVEGNIPSLEQLPGGETVLALQLVDEGEKDPYMVVYFGSKEAKYFTHASEPFPRTKGVPSVCNSVYVKGHSVITAVTSTEIDGKRGVWLIDGNIIRK
jgi:hypothetical protein